eukprot:TRINITY_DN7744_c0_g1_i1.p1 TRINITY_DN7744_c0_g1~~TRINITY_DN7744_c0_g1_i1.p1  ORF type:complete len:260 (-),score=13.41 TRINITY_DN7744_c0_g1_i1:277-1056(-)
MKLQCTIYFFFCFGGLIETVVSAPIACSVYSTNGRNQLAVDEGSKLTAPDGEKSVAVSGVQECAAACEVTNDKCQSVCCDAFSYNPQKLECWLKSGGSRFQSSSNIYGWQTYWRIGSGSFNGDSVQELTLQIEGTAACEEDLIPSDYQDVYITRGPGQLSVNEGQNQLLANGSASAVVTSASECAIECRKVAGCNSFSINPNNGNCYLKKGQQFNTRQNSRGWQSYWLVSKSTAPQYCSSEEWYCMFCGGKFGNSCRNY